jgi:serine phosphatase RsbU (regulator of sigma subunit)
VTIRNTILSSATGGYVSITVLEAFLTLVLTRHPHIVDMAPGLLYLYLLIITFAALVWTLPHAIYSVALAMALQDIWLFRPHGELSLTLQHDVRLAVFAAIAIALALVQNRLMSHQRRLEVEAELNGEVTRTLQRVMVPNIVEIPGYEAAAFYETASVDAAVGGDFMDVFRISDDRVGIVIGDVTGHGVDAAVQAVQIRYMLATCALQRHSPAQCLAAVNNVLNTDSRLVSQASMAYGILDTSEHILTFATGGHEPLLVWRNAMGYIEELSTEGLLLGVAPEEDGHYENATTSLGEGDIVLFYTDGASEARRGNDFFGVDRLKAAMWSVSSEPGDTALPWLHQTICDFAHGSLHDDIAMLWIRRNDG